MIKAGSRRDAGARQGFPTTPVSLAMVTLLAGCAEPVVTDERQLAPANYSELSAIWGAVPIEEKGWIPAVPSADERSAADYRIVVYLNAGVLPPPSLWCDPTIGFREDAAAATTELRIAAALCRRGEVVTTAQGRVPLATTTREQRERDVAEVERELLDQLDPDPDHGMNGG